MYNKTIGKFNKIQVPKEEFIKRLKNNLFMLIVRFCFGREIT